MPLGAPPAPDGAVVVMAGADVVVAVVVALEVLDDVLDSSVLSDPPQATVMVLTANAAAIAAVTESRRGIRVWVMSALVFYA